MRAYAILTDGTGACCAFDPSFVHLRLDLIHLAIVAFTSAAGGDQAATPMRMTHEFQINVTEPAVKLHLTHPGMNDAFRYWTV